MRILVVGAAGKAGAAIATEAVQRGHEVTAVSRREVDTPAQHNLVKDAFDLTAEDLRGAEVIIDALAFPDPSQHTPFVLVLADAATAAGARLLVVGGGEQPLRRPGALGDARRYPRFSGGVQRHRLRPD